MATKQINIPGSGVTEVPEDSVEKMLRAYPGATLVEGKSSGGATAPAATASAPTETPSTGSFLDTIKSLFHNPLEPPAGSPAAEAQAPTKKFNPSLESETDTETPYARNMNEMMDYFHQKGAGNAMRIGGDTANVASLVSGMGGPVTLGKGILQGTQLALTALNHYSDLEGNRGAMDMTVGVVSALLHIPPGTAKSMLSNPYMRGLVQSALTHLAGSAAHGTQEAVQTGDVGKGVQAAKDAVTNPLALALTGAGGLLGGFFGNRAKQIGEAAPNTNAAASVRGDAALTEASGVPGPVTALEPPKVNPEDLVSGVPAAAGQQFQDAIKGHSGFQGHMADLHSGINQAALNAGETPEVARAAVAHVVGKDALQARNAVEALEADPSTVLAHIQEFRDSHAAGAKKALEDWLAKLGPQAEKVPLAQKVKAVLAGDLTHAAEVHKGLYNGEWDQSGLTPVEPTVNAPKGATTETPVPPTQAPQQEVAASSTTVPPSQAPVANAATTANPSAPQSNPDLVSRLNAVNNNSSFTRALRESIVGSKPLSKAHEATVAALEQIAGRFSPEETALIDAAREKSLAVKDQSRIAGVLDPVKQMIAERLGVSRDEAATVFARLKQLHTVTNGALGSLGGNAQTRGLAHTVEFLRQITEPGGTAGNPVAFPEAAQAAQAGAVGVQPPPQTAPAPEAPVTTAQAPATPPEAPQGPQSGDFKVLGLAPGNMVRISLGGQEAVVPLQDLQKNPEATVAKAFGQTASAPPQAAETPAVPAEPQPVAPPRTLPGVALPGVTPAQEATVQPLRPEDLARLGSMADRASAQPIPPGTSLAGRPDVDYSRLMKPFIAGAPTGHAETGDSQLLNFLGDLDKRLKPGTTFAGYGPEEARAVMALREVAKDPSNIASKIIEPLIAGKPDANLAAASGLMKVAEREGLTTQVQQGFTQYLRQKTFNPDKQMYFGLGEAIQKTGKETLNTIFPTNGTKVYDAGVFMDAMETALAKAVKADKSQLSTTDLAYGGHDIIRALAGNLRLKLSGVVSFIARAYDAFGQNPEQFAQVYARNQKNLAKLLDIAKNPGSYTAVTSQIFSQAAALFQTPTDSQ